MRCFIEVRVDPWTHQRNDFGFVASNIFNGIFDHARGGNDLYFSAAVFFRGRASSKGESNTQHDKKQLKYRY
jgi:hypothetical protein